VSVAGRLNGDEMVQIWRFGGSENLQVSERSSYQCARLSSEEREGLE